MKKHQIQHFLTINNRSSFQSVCDVCSDHLIMHKEEIAWAVSPPLWWWWLGGEGGGGAH